MSDQTTPDSELIRHMLETAEQEAASIREEAEKSLADRRRSLEKRLRKIREEAEDRVKNESEKLRIRADATIELEQNRSRLRMENRIYRAVDQRARDALRERRDAPDYPRVLRAWVVEAALGLGASEATVSAPEEDRAAVKQVLDDAIAELRSTHGVDVAFTPDEELEISGQGVVLRSVPPTMAYSNTVDDRIRRFGPEIRSVVYSTVIEEAHE